jgi:hypothetical protein
MLDGLLDGPENKPSNLEELVEQKQSISGELGDLGIIYFWFPPLYCSEL